MDNPLDSGNKNKTAIVFLIGACVLVFFTLSAVFILTKQDVSPRDNSALVNPNFTIGNNSQGFGIDLRHARIGKDKKIDISADFQNSSTVKKTIVGKFVIYNTEWVPLAVSNQYKFDISAGDHEDKEWFNVNIPNLPTVGSAVYVGVDFCTEGTKDCQYITGALDDQRYLNRPGELWAKVRLYDCAVTLEFTDDTNWTLYKTKDTRSILLNEDTLISSGQIDAKKETVRIPLYSSYTANTDLLLKVRGNYEEYGNLVEVHKVPSSYLTKCLETPSSTPSIKPTNTVVPTNTPVVTPTQIPNYPRVSKSITNGSVNSKMLEFELTAAKSNQIIISVATRDRNAKISISGLDDKWKELSNAKNVQNQGRMAIFASSMANTVSGKVTITTTNETNILANVVVLENVTSVKSIYNYAGPTVDNQDVKATVEKPTNSKILLVNTWHRTKVLKTPPGVDNYPILMNSKVGSSGDTVRLSTWYLNAGGALQTQVGSSGNLSGKHDWMMSVLAIN